MAQGSLTTQHYLALIRGLGRNRRCNLGPTHYHTLPSYSCREFRPRPTRCGPSMGVGSIACTHACIWPAIGAGRGDLHRAYRHGFSSSCAGRCDDPTQYAAGHACQATHGMGDDFTHGWRHRYRELRPDRWLHLTRCAYWMHNTLLMTMT